MKKLWISIGMALGLLAAPAIATAQTESTAELNQYLYQTKAGIFTDLSTIQETDNLKKYTLGADLSEGTSLQNSFFIANAAGDNFEHTSFAADLAEDDESRVKPAVALSTLGIQKLLFVKSEMKGIALSAIGGILFTDTETDNKPTVNCQTKVERNSYLKQCLRAHMIDKDGEFINPTKGTNVPVVLVVGTDANKGQYLWVQFDYMVDGMNWVYQIRYYADGQADFIVKTLGEASTLTDKAYKFQPIFQQRNGDDTRLCITAGNDKESETNNWNIIETTTFNKWWGLNVSPQSIPEEGRTISILPPLDPTAFSCDNDQVTIKPTAISGNIAFDPSKTTQAAFDATDKIILIVSEYATASWITLDGSKTPAVGDKGASYEVLYFGKPSSFTASNLPFNATGLEQDKNYTIHAYSVMENASAKKPYAFTAGIASFTFKTSKIELPTVTIGEITADGYAKLTFGSAEGFSTMLVQSNKPTAPAVSGKLQQGDGLGTNGTDGVVVGVWDAATTSYDLPLKVDEGCYLHFYRVADAGTDNAVYSNAVSVTVYRPAETLPLSWSFNENQITGESGSALPLLPPGWTQDANNSTSGYKCFYVLNSNIEAIGYVLKAYLANVQPAVLTPAFILSTTSKVEAIFTSAYSSGTSLNENDWIRIEYREDGGEWQLAKTFNNTDLTANAQGLLELSVSFNCTAGKKMEMRYTLNNTSESYSSHYIKSLEVKAYNPCRKPTDVTIAADATTDKAVKLSWNAIAEATAFTVAYQEAGTDTPDAWTEKPATAKKLTLDGLKERTAYRIKIAAACTIEGEDYTSPFTDVVTATTYAAAPYHERMDNVYEDPDDYESDLLSSPANRGVTTYTGNIDGALSENTGAGFTWHADNTIQSLNRKPETAMGVTEAFENGAVLLTPVIHVDREDLVLNVTLTSFSVTKNADNTLKEIVKGAAPKDAGCKLHIAVSNTGSFTEADIVKTLTGDELKLDNSVVKILLEKKGNVQIGLFFDNPTPNWTDPVYYLEVSDLKLIPDEKYTLTAAAAPAEGGTVSGAGEHYMFDEVTLRAIANNGYDFVAWKNGETELSTSAIYTFEMPGENVTYTAHFALHEYDLNLTASPAAGGTVEGAKKYTMGADVTIKATPAQGYVFAAWMNGETEVSKKAEYTFKMPASDLSYTAKFEKPKYELTLASSSPRAGSVEGAGSYEADADVTIKATPAEGYVFVAWMKGETEVSKEAEYTFKMPAEKTHYMALFKADKQEFTLTLNASPADAGTVEGAGKHEAGTDVTIKATANEGYEFVAWMNGETEVSKEAEYTFKMPAENVTYTATFAKKSANEDVLRANFNLYAKDGRLHIRNLAGMTVSSVEVYSLNGRLINRFAPDSREDLSLAVAAERALVFVRIHTERGAAIYKIYLP